MAEGYYRFPTLHNETVVFVCEDDLWSVPASGGIARRLTSNVGEVTRPLLSPDGKQLAYVGREEGHAELYVMSALGGPARRLTYMGGGTCIPSTWTDSGRIIFASNAEHWYLRFTNLFSVAARGAGVGSAPEQLNYGLARTIAFGPAGGVLLGRNTDDPARWKRYRGGTAGQIWIDVKGSGKFKPLLKLGGNISSPMWLAASGTAKGRVYFIADHEGVGNLYSCLPTGKNLLRHTDHEEFYARNASTDGKRIVYHAGGDLYLFNPETNSTTCIEIALHSPQTQRKRRFASPERYLESYSLHPRGQSTAIVTRGKVFSFANWEGAVVQHRTSEQANVGSSESIEERPATGVRYRLAEWLADGKRLVAISDEGGEEAFVLLTADGSAPPQRLPDLDIGRPEAIQVNPLKNQIAFSNHRYELYALDLETKELRFIDRSKAEPVAGFAWSPDGEWVVYSASQSLHQTALKLWKSSTGETLPITQPVLRDVFPSFDPKGRFIYFISYRLFDPVPDNLHFDLSFPRGMRPHLITLQKDTLSPFIPRPRDQDDAGEDAEKPENCEEVAQPAEPNGEPAEGAEAAAGEAAEEKTGEQPEKKEAQTIGPKLMQIDLEGIESRVIAFPLQEGIYGRIRGTKDGKVLFTRYPLEGSLGQSESISEPSANGSLVIYDYESQKEDTLFFSVTDFGLNMQADTIIYRSGNHLRVFKASDKPSSEGNGPNRKNGWLDLDRISVEVLPGAEWRQMFREAWRLQRDQFWTPDMALVDWVAIHDRYLPLVDRVSSRSEFSDLMWEMQGELGTSHAYEYGGDYRPEPYFSLGFLGAAFAWDAEASAWVIRSILKGDPWEPRADSPLNSAGVNVQVGDCLVAINGRRLSAALSPQQALVRLADQEVELTIGRSCEPNRNITVKTLPGEAAVRYRHWVEDNRQRVHAATRGRVGYLHIPDMGPAGYAEFHRGFLAEVDRDGLIVDVRYNRGGYVSALILEKLARRRLGYDMARWNQFPIPYPPDSVAGPQVALINEYAGSDGDIFSHGFKSLGLGPLIGTRTWGGVIGINPRLSLVDGTVTTQPEYSFWFDDVGWGVENYGVDPDIEAEITPQDYSKGKDPQLERGIQEILKLLETKPPILPEFSNRPSRALPRLPER